MRGLFRQLSYRWGPRAASALRKQWLLLRHPHVDIRFDGPVYLGPGFSLFCPEGGTFHVGPDVEFRRGFRCELHGGEVHIGGGTAFTYYVLLQCTSRIDIGERCVFAQSAIVVDGNHRFRDASRPMLDQGYDLVPVTIGDDAFIAAKATVMADVGERSVVGANSVVTKPVPAYSVAAGAPAQVIEDLRPSPA
jgi:acetyltransferase-like isoleucine patch superfamily enzyme